jgi:hypothetical protein
VIAEALTDRAWPDADHPTRIGALPTFYSAVLHDDHPAG